MKAMHLTETFQLKMISFLQDKEKQKIVLNKLKATLLR